jgi:polyisoprenoid-binding protein YceI
MWGKTGVGLAGFVSEIEGTTFRGHFAKWQGKIRYERQRLLNNNRVVVQEVSTGRQTAACLQIAE